MISKTHVVVFFQTQDQQIISVPTYVERGYRGDVMRDFKYSRSGDRIFSDVSLGTSIKVLADGYMNAHYLEALYCLWEGQRWTISNVQIDRPNAILQLGQLYRGL